MTEGEFSPLVRKENSVSDLPSRLSPLDAVHVAAGAAFTDFAGWKMPVRYGSDLAEHETVRTAAGLFDLSHMAEFIVQGTHAAQFLDYALAGQASVIVPGRAKYSLLLAEEGGILDDLVVYRLDDQRFLVVANAANHDVVAAALAERQADFDVAVSDETDTCALIAVQGPDTLEVLSRIDDARCLPVLRALRRPEVLQHRRRLLRRDRHDDRPHRLHRRRRIRAVPRQRRRSRALGRTRGRGRGALRTRRPRHPAPRGRDAALRPRTLDRNVPGAGRHRPRRRPRQAGRLRRPRRRRSGSGGRRSRARRPDRRGQACGSRRIPGAARWRGDRRSHERCAVADSRHPDCDGVRRPRRVRRIGTELALDVRGTAIPARVVSLPFYSRKAAS